MLAENVAGAHRRSGGARLRPGRVSAVRRADAACEADGAARTACACLTGSGKGNWSSIRPSAFLLDPGSAICLESNDGQSRPRRQCPASEGVRLRHLAGAALLLQAEGDHQLSVREEPCQPALSRRACASPLPERRGALHRVQALRGDLSGTGDHHRGRSAPQRRDAPRGTLRPRHGEVHLLRLLPGGLPGRRHRRGPELRVRDRDARGALLRQGQAARERRPLGARPRPQHHARTRPTDDAFSRSSSTSSR